MFDGFGIRILSSTKIITWYQRVQQIQTNDSVASVSFGSLVAIENDQMIK